MATSSSKLSGNCSICPRHCQAGGAAHEEDDPVRRLRAPDQVPPTLPGDVVGDHAVVTQVDIGLIVADLHMQERLPGLGEYVASFWDSFAEGRGYPVRTRGGREGVVW
jgi:hypothetical protein